MKTKFLLISIILIASTPAFCQFTYNANNDAVLINEGKSVNLNASVANSNPKLKVSSLASGQYGYGQSGQFSISFNTTTYHLHLLQNYSGGASG